MRRCSRRQLLPRRWRRRRRRRRLQRLQRRLRGRRASTTTPPTLTRRSLPTPTPTLETPTRKTRSTTPRRCRPTSPAPSCHDPSLCEPSHCTPSACARSCGEPPLRVEQVGTHAPKKHTHVEKEGASPGRADGSQKGQRQGEVRAKTSKSRWRIVKAMHRENDFFPNFTGEFDEDSPFAKHFTRKRD